MKLISVFGSARPQPGTAPYQVAEETGRLLALNSFAVATGGYYGVMGGVSEGANKAGGHVVGVTSDQIEAYRPLPPNPYITEEIRYPTLRERLLHLIVENDGMICLPGGVGTLAEFALAWNFLEIGEIKPRPFICVGDVWKVLVEEFYNESYVSIEYLDYIQYADTPAEAVQMLLDSI